MAGTGSAPVNKVKGKTSSSASSGRKGERSFTGADLANALRKMVKAEYPGMTDAHAMRLAVMLAKAELKGDIKT